MPDDDAYQPNPRFPSFPPLRETAPSDTRARIGPSAVRLLIAAMLTGAIYASVLAYVPGFELPVHVFTIACLAIASIAGILGRFRLDNRFNAFEIAMFVAYLFSFLAYLNNHDDYVLYYTTASVLTVACCSIIARSVPTRLILNAAVAAYFLMMATLYAYYGADILRALDAHSANRWMIRIFPFGIHPDLLGLIFGAGSVLLLCRAADASRAMKVVLGSGVVLSIALVLAASARSSLLALVVALVLMVALLFRHMTPRAKVSVIWISAGLALLGVIFFGSIVSYLNVILELDSSTRGLSSGGSGRTEAWSQGIDLIVGGGVQPLIGGGLRWASIDNIGFSTEDSYLTIILESGIIVGLLLIFVMYRAIAKSYLLTRQTDANATEWWNNVAAMGILLFAAIESFFNRYFLAIGNPLSLLLIFLFLAYSYIGPPRPGARTPPA